MKNASSNFTLRGFRKTHQLRRASSPREHLVDHVRRSGVSEVKPETRGLGEDDFTGGEGGLTQRVVPFWGMNSPRFHTAGRMNLA